MRKNIILQSLEKKKKGKLRRVSMKRKKYILNLKVFRINFLKCELVLGSR